MVPLSGRIPSSSRRLILLENVELNIGRSIPSGTEVSAPVVILEGLLKEVRNETLVEETYGGIESYFSVGTLYKRYLLDKDNNVDFSGRIPKSVSIPCRIC